MTPIRLLVLGVAASLVGGCDLPKDPEGTLQHVRGAVLHVGVTGADGLTDREEQKAIERLAADLGAKIEYQSGELHRLADQLEHGEIEIIADQIPSDTPFSKHLGLSSPVSEIVIGNKRKKTVFAVRKGENGFLMAVERAIEAK